MSCRMPRTTQLQLNSETARVAWAPGRNKTATHAAARSTQLARQRGVHTTRGLHSPRAASRSWRALRRSSWAVGMCRRCGWPSPGLYMWMVGKRCGGQGKRAGSCCALQSKDRRTNSGSAWFTVVSDWRGQQESQGRQISGNTGASRTRRTTAAAQRQADTRDIGGSAEASRKSTLMLNRAQKGGSSTCLHLTDRNGTTPCITESSADQQKRLWGSQVSTSWRGNRAASHIAGVVPAQAVGQPSEA